jgi:hypothetical protein
MCLDRIRETLYLKNFNEIKGFLSVEKSKGYPEISTSCKQGYPQS